MSIIIVVGPADSSIPYTPTAATTGRSDSSSALLGLSVVVPPAPGGSSALRNTSTMSAHPAALPAGVGLSSPPYSSGSGGASTAGQRQLQQSRHLSARSYGSNGSSGATSGEDGAGSTSAPETAPEESEQPPLQQGGKVDSAEVRHQALHRAALAALQATTPTSTTSSSRGQHPSAQSFSGPSPSQQEQELGSQQSRPVPVFAKRAHLPHHDSDDSDASDTELQYETERYTGSTDHDTGGTGVGSVHDSVRSAAASLASPAPIYGATVSSAGPAQVQLRTHEELDLLIPALRSMGGGAAGANSSDSEEESSSSLGDMGSTVGSTVGSALGSVAGSTAGSVASAAATRAPSIAGDSDV